VQKILIFITLIATGYLLITIVNYWRADYLYAQGRSYNSIKRPDIATKYLTQAIGLEPAEPLYREELASSYVSLALTLNQQKDTNDANQFASAATSEIEKAESLSPANVILKRTEYGVFMNLAGLNSDYLVNARDTLIAAVALAPTDAKLHYYLGLTYARIGQVDLSLKTLAETIALKSDYQDARDAYAIILKAEKSAK
jgi:tetratricopeptide (TPR) repeat protein